MSALLWKSLHTLKQRRIRLIILLILPVVYLFVLLQRDLKGETIAVFFPAAFTLFSSAVHFSMDDLAGSESILATPISILKMWLYNLFFVIVTGHLYCIALLAAGFAFMGQDFGTLSLSFNSIGQLAANLILCFAFLGASTCHYADYGMGKQIVASVFALINLASPFALLLWGSAAVINTTGIVVTAAVGLVLFVLFFLLTARADKEKLLINTQKLTSVYSYSVDE
ncbi:hypothetical protein [Paenibacillus zanthoxyli]|uniref:hypothetical protein n=1 Tax=Paenibacillus zanthoxyli TaxID=369399 RepID=UPI0012EB0E04|nr:hypothetical protein [Paenibacillus zanthoxyli]